MTVDRLEVSYCEGWDPHIRAAVGPVSSAGAAGRDRAGEQYAVLLAVSGRPFAVIEVAWRDLYCAVRFFDEQLRRVYEVDCRRLAEDRLFVTGGREWRYADAAQPEFDECASRRVFEISPEGDVGGYTVGWPMAAPSGAGCVTPTERRARPEDYRLDVPQFGDWGRLIRAFPYALAALGHEVPVAVILDDVSDPGGEGLPPARRPWHAPRPLQPAYLDLLFRAGTRFVLDTSGFMSDVGDTVIVEQLPAGTLRMPSGRLIAADPAWIHADAQPFTATVAPGEYPVLLSLVRWADNPRHQRVAAAKLAIRGEPAASWELALLPGQDLRILGDGAFFGFGVDAGMGCFFDATAAPAMARHSPTFVLGDDTTGELSDPEAGANLIAFSSGWGDGAYPTWIGRTTSGDIACFIADMLVLGDNAVPDPEQV
jgi:uncharacterized protein DUF4241